jgi:cytochrome c oxidase cbb3-type subunit 2
MKNGALLFLGIFAALGVSWAGIVMGSHAQLGSLAPYYDDTDNQSYPNGFPGAASRGDLVYRDLNCASCHTQQVRRPGFGADEARGWGDRQSVARDYIYEPYVELGDSRNGPDLANLAARKPQAPDAASLFHLLYTGQGGMPPYTFLFREQKISGQTSDHALKLTGALAPAAGYEIVPTPRAEALVSYLLSLSSPYDYPETRQTAAPAKTEGAKK